MQPRNSGTSTSAPPPGALLLVCISAPDGPLRAALSALEVDAFVAQSLASAHALLMNGEHDFSAVALLGADSAGPVLDLLETMRAKGMVATLMATPGGLASYDAALLQEAGVELAAGITPERQLRAIRERFEADPGLRHDAGRRSERRAELALDDIAAVSDAMARITAQGRRALRTGLPVLIEGEHGVGKLALARALHVAGMRRQRPLRQLDAIAVCDGLAVATARLGVDVERGLVDGEAGGSLYLRDIGDWPAQAQADLAELLRRRNARAGRPPADSPLRIFAGARRPLIDLVREGSFREDLYYLLSVAPVTLSPLRTRPDDIARLADAMLTRLRAGRAATLRGGLAASFSDAALQALTSEAWPGNTGQLRARVLRAAHITSGTVIGSVDVAPPGPATAHAAAANDPVLRLPGEFASGLLEDDARRHGAAPGALPQFHDFLDIFDPQGNLRPLAEIEAGVIRFAVRHYRGQMSEVSRRLGIGRSTLYRKLKDLDMNPEREAAPECDAARGWPEGAAAQAS